MSDKFSVVTAQTTRHKFFILAPLTHSDQEERRLQQRTNPKSTVTMTINATDLFSLYDEESPFLDLR